MFQTLTRIFQVLNESKKTSQIDFHSIEEAHIRFYLCVLFSENAINLFGHTIGN